MVSNFERKRRQTDTDPRRAGSIMRHMARAPKYCKDAVCRKAQQQNGQIVWIHDRMIVAYDVKAMYPEDMDILVPSEAELGEVYNPKNPKADGAFQTDLIVFLRRSSQEEADAHQVDCCRCKVELVS